MHYAIQEHKSDRHLQMKKITNHAREDTCILYFYYYNVTYTEENRSAVDRRQQEQPDTSMKSVTTSSDNPMDSVMESKKRKGPETRTVVLAPEKKRQKMEYLKKDVEFMKSWYTSTATKNVVQLDFAPDWHTGYDLITATTRNFLMKHYDMERQNYDYLFHLAYKTGHEALACLRTARIYKVDDKTAVLEDCDITPQMWPEIDEADKKETQQFDIQTYLSTSTDSGHGEDRYEVGSEVETLYGQVSEDEESILCTWQLSLHTFLEELGTTRSKMDENCFYWKKENKKKVNSMNNMYAMIITHVDDLAVINTTTWLDEHYNKFVKRFQKVTRQQLPFDRCGHHFRCLFTTSKGDSCGSKGHQGGKCSA